MSWRNLKIFAIVALAAAFLINSLPAPSDEGAVARSAPPSFDVAVAAAAPDDASRASPIARVSLTR